MKDLGLSNFHLQDFIWWNKNVSLKHKPFFYYSDWFEKGIHCINNLYVRGRVKTFEELVLEFDIAIKDRRKYNSLMNGIYLSWFDISLDINEDIFEKIVTELVNKKKIPKHAYPVLRNVRYDSSCEKRTGKWKDIFFINDEIVQWDAIHMNNYKCTIETQLRSFYFKVFHDIIGLNAFLFKIKKIEDPKCKFCTQEPETVCHLFVQCPRTLPL